MQVLPWNRFAQGDERGALELVRRPANRVNRQAGVLLHSVGHGQGAIELGEAEGLLANSLAGDITAYLEVGSLHARFQVVGESRRVAEPGQRDLDLRRAI